MKGCKCMHPACLADNGTSCVTEQMLSAEEWHDSLPYLRYKVKVLKEDLETVKHQRDTYSHEAFELSEQLKGQQVLQKNIGKLVSLVHNRRGVLEAAHYDNAPIEPKVKTFQSGASEIRYLENIEWGLDSCTKSDMSFAFVNGIATVTFARGYCTEVVLVSMDNGQILAVTSYGKDFN
jgi:hypothetical protein